MYIPLCSLSARCCFSPKVSHGFPRIAGSWELQGAVRYAECCSPGQLRTSSARYEGRSVYCPPQRISGVVHRDVCIPETATLPTTTNRSLQYIVSIPCRDHNESIPA